jgi:hypothetical protein
MMHVVNILLTLNHEHEFGINILVSYTYRGRQNLNVYI